MINMIKNSVHKITSFKTKFSKKLQLLQAPPVVLIGIFHLQQFAPPTLKSVLPPMRRRHFLKAELMKKMRTTTDGFTPQR